LAEILKILSKVLPTGRAIRNWLIIDQSASGRNLKYSGRNLPGVKIINLENINIVDIINCRQLLLTVEAIKVLSVKAK